jgi:hypothetical protein
MKITLSAAMRARDVSRPRPEQLAEAAAREEPPTRPEPSARPEPTARAGSAAMERGATPAAEGAAQPRTRRRRRRIQ